MRHVVGKFLENVHIPVAVEVPEAEPGLQAQVMQNVENRRVGAEKPDLGLLLLLVVPGPEMLEKIHPSGDAMPPGEDRVKVTLVAAVVGLDLLLVTHQKIEGAVGGLQHHHSRVEQRGVVPSGSDLRQGE